MAFANFYGVGCECLDRIADERPNECIARPSLMVTEKLLIVTGLALRETAEGPKPEIRRRDPSLNEGNKQPDGI